MHKDVIHPRLSPSSWWTQHRSKQKKCSCESKHCWLSIKLSKNRKWWHLAVQQGSSNLWLVALMWQCHGIKRASIEVASPIWEKGVITVCYGLNCNNWQWKSFVIKLSLEVDSCGDCGSLLYVIAEVWYLNVWEGGPAFAEKRQPPCFSDNNGFWKMSMSCKMIHSNSTRFFTNFTVLVQSIELASPIWEKERSLCVVASTAIDILLIQYDELCCAFSIFGFFEPKDSTWLGLRQIKTICRSFLFVTGFHVSILSSCQLWGCSRLASTKRNHTKRIVTLQRFANPWKRAESQCVLAA